MSLQRRWECNTTIHVWKNVNDVPIPVSQNGINIKFKDNARLGMKAELPSFNKNASRTLEQPPRPTITHLQ